jgi:hypothetical protein
MTEETIYILMSDDSGTTFSSAMPIGIAVKTKEAAEEFKNGKRVGYGANDYKEVKLKDSYYD